MSDVLYITSSSYSGSTLLAFLLNSHRDIFTVSEMEGWPHGETERYRCSCGKVLQECPFIHRVSERFARDGFQFDTHNFGTSYEFLGSGLANNLATGKIPGLSWSWTERMRDRVLRGIPRLRRRIGRIDHYNAMFIEAGLDYRKARVFVDASKNPYRLYLVRDVRGVALTFMERRRCSARTAARMWLAEQQMILRVAAEFPGFHTVVYEDLCDRTDETLAAIHRFVGLPPQPFSGNFREAEHHIFGNSMRLEGVDRIVKSERWKQKLSSAEIGEIEAETKRFLDSGPNPVLGAVLPRYLGT